MADHQRDSLLFLALFSCLIYSSYSYQFVVGGRDGWAVKPSENYNHWSGRMRFQVNDTLLFRYKSGSDSVVVVNKDDYDKCNAANPIIKLDDGNSFFKFNRSGPFYFISGNKSNCDQGQKLHVVVLSPRTPRSPPQVPSAAAPPPHGSSPSQSPASPVPAISPSSTPPSGGAPVPTATFPSPSAAPTSVAPAPSGAGPAPSEPPSPSTTPGAPSSSPPESGGAAPSGGSSEPPSASTTPGAPSSSTADSPGSSPPESGAPAPPCSNLLISRVSLVLSVGVFVFLL